MNVEVAIQYAMDPAGLPSRKAVKTWVKAALHHTSLYRRRPRCASFGCAFRGRRTQAQVTIRIVDEQEGAELNQRWRKREGPTNVLSFPCTGLEAIAPELLGDVVICAPVVEREAIEQNKTPHAHWAHMVIHGILHLLGFDHIKESQALIMEELETRILRQLGYPDPYKPVDLT